MSNPGSAGQGSPQQIQAMPSVAGAREHWEMVRSAIVHEDNLVNHRLTWLLSLHAFVLIAFGAVQSGVLNSPPGKENWVKGVVEACLGGLFLAAFFASRAVLYSINTAMFQLCLLASWWRGKYPEACGTSSPQIVQAWMWYKVVENSNSVPISVSDDIEVGGGHPPIKGEAGSKKPLWLWRSPPITVIPALFQIIDLVMCLVCWGLAILYAWKSGCV